MQSYSSEEIDETSRALPPRAKRNVAIARAGRYVNDFGSSEPLNFGESRLRVKEGPRGHASRGKSEGQRRATGGALDEVPPFKDGIIGGLEKRGLGNAPIPERFAERANYLRPLVKKSFLPEGADSTIFA